MKQSCKRLLAAVLTLCVLLGLSGCRALDEMRHCQAFLSADSNILWNGTTYKALPESEYFCPESDYDTLVHVTESDVPVLLSGIFCLMDCYVGVDTRFLLSDDDHYYCDTAIYEEIAEQIRAPFLPEIFCYSFEEYGEDVYDIKSATFTLTQEQVDVITTVVENTEPTTMQDGMYLDTEWCLALEECSQNMLFRRSTIDISYTGNTYYLELYTDQDKLLFTVPSACNDQFDQITEAYRKSLESWEAFWGEDFDIELDFEDEYI